MVAVLALGWAFARAAVAQSATVATVWYRSSEQCPDGPSFLTRLERRGLHGKLAGVGDRVDFVVTLGADDHGASGRLERQTQAATVAIRKFDAQSCEEVVDALALSLALTFQPIADASESPSAVAMPPEASISPAHEPDGAPRPGPLPADQGRHDRMQIDKRRVEWAAGADAVLSTGIAPDPMPGVAVFLERATIGPTVLSPSFRAAAFGGQSSSATSRGDLRVRLLSLRLESCPLVFGVAAISLRPCAGADAGFIAAEGAGPTGKSDGHPWIDVGIHGRLLWAPIARIALEAEAGGLVPVTRYAIEFENPPELVHRTAPVAFQGGIGTAIRWV